MTELNIQIEELISKNATDFKSQKYLKLTIKTILTQLIQQLKQLEEKIFSSNTQNILINF